MSLLAPLSPGFEAGMDAEAAWVAMACVPMPGGRMLLCPDTQPLALLAEHGQGSSQVEPHFPLTPDLCRDYLGGLCLGWLPSHTLNLPIPEAGVPVIMGELVIL